MGLDDLLRRANSWPGFTSTMGTRLASWSGCLGLLWAAGTIGSWTDILTFPLGFLAWVIPFGWVCWRALRGHTRGLLFTLFTSGYLWFAAYGVRLGWLEWQRGAPAAWAYGEGALGQHSDLDRETRTYPEGLGCFLAPGMLLVLVPRWETTRLLSLTLGPPEGAWLGRYPTQDEMVATLAGHGAPATLTPSADGSEPPYLLTGAGPEVTIPGFIADWELDAAVQDGLVGFGVDRSRVLASLRGAWEPAANPDWVAVAGCGGGDPEHVRVSVFATATGESFFHLEAAGALVGCPEP